MYFVRLGSNPSVCIFAPLAFRYFWRVRMAVGRIMCLVQSNLFTLKLRRLIGLLREFHPFQQPIFVGRAER